MMPGASLSLYSTVQGLRRLIKKTAKLKFIYQPCRLLKRKPVPCVIHVPFLTLQLTDHHQMDCDGKES